MRDQDGITLIDIPDVEVMRVADWIVWCRIGGAEVAIPRAQIFDPIELAPGPATIVVPLWFARLKRLVG